MPMMPAPQNNQPIGLGDILNRVAKRKMLIYSVSFLGFAASALSLNFTTPLYEAKAKIAFQSIHAISVEGHKEALYAPDLALKVMADLDLANTKNISNKKEALFKDIKILDPNNPSEGEFIFTQEYAPLIHDFLNNLKAKRIDSSNVIEVSFRHEDPYLAARISNAIAFNYIKSLTPEDKKELKHNDAMIKKLQTRIAELNKAIYEVNKAILQTGHTNAKAPVPNAAKRQGLEAQLNHLKAQKAALYSGNGIVNPNADSPILKNDHILITMRQEHAKKQTSLKDLSLYYGHRHPTIIALNQEIKDLNSKIEMRSNKLAQDIEDRYQKINQALAKLEDTQEQKSSSNLELLQAEKALKQDNLATLKELLSTYNAQEKQSTKHIAQSLPAAKVISQAVIPSKAVFPNKTATLVRGTATAFFLALFLSLLIERKRKTFVSGRQIEAALHLPCYALIPKANPKIGARMVEDVLDDEENMLADAVRTLRLNLNLAAKHKKSKNQVIALTSSMSGEGKSTLSCWMAKLAAQAGERVILIDADMRKPRVHEYLDRENTITLNEHLEGNATLEDVINYTDPTGMHVIYARSNPSKAMNLISSKNMESMIRKLRKSYDLIIIDTPACMAVSDAKAITRQSDQLLYVVSWNGVKREVVHNGISQFTKTGDTDIATVLTNVDVKKHVEFGYGDVVSAYDDYKEYAPI